MCDALWGGGGLGSEACGVIVIRWGVWGGVFSDTDRVVRGECRGGINILGFGGWLLGLAEYNVLSGFGFFKGGRH